VPSWLRGDLCLLFLTQYAEIRVVAQVFYKAKNVLFSSTNVYTLRTLAHLFK